jgi:hypothetical protein
LSFFHTCYYLLCIQIKTWNHFYRFQSFVHLIEFLHLYCNWILFIIEKIIYNFFQFKFHIVEKMVTIARRKVWIINQIPIWIERYAAIIIKLKLFFSINKSYKIFWQLLIKFFFNINRYYWKFYILFMLFLVESLRL